MKMGRKRKKSFVIRFDLYDSISLTKKQFHLSCAQVLAEQGEEGQGQIRKGAFEGPRNKAHAAAAAAEIGF